MIENYLIKFKLMGKSKKTIFQNNTSIISFWKNKIKNVLRKTRKYADICTLLDIDNIYINNTAIFLLIPTNLNVKINLPIYLSVQNISVVNKKQNYGKNVICWKYESNVITSLFL